MMLASEKKKPNSKGSHLLKSAVSGHQANEPVHFENQVPDDYMSLGNQARQRFAQSCPMNLPAPSSCPFGGMCHSCPLPIQAKLKVSQPDDEYEREADRVADEVMRMPDPVTCEGANTREQTYNSRAQGECSGVKKQLRSPLHYEGETFLQTNEIANLFSDSKSAMEYNLLALRDDGQPLPNYLRTFFEPRFGVDLSQIHIHTDRNAEESARLINARAYTRGRHIVLGASQYNPYSNTGKLLLAHEITHVIQQVGTISPVELIEKKQILPVRKRPLATKMGFSGRPCGGMIQRAAAPAAIAIAIIEKVLIDCAIGVLIGMAIDLAWQLILRPLIFGKAPFNWCSLIWSAFLGCLTGILGGAIFSALVRGASVTTITGRISYVALSSLEKFILWLLSKGIIIPAFVLAFLAKLGCISPGVAGGGSVPTVSSGGSAPSPVPKSNGLPSGGEGPGG